MAQEFQDIYQVLLMYLTAYFCHTDRTFHKMATKCFLKGGRILYVLLKGEQFQFPSFVFCSGVSTGYNLLHTIATQWYTQTLFQ